MTFFFRILEASIDEKSAVLLQTVTALRDPGGHDAPLRLAFEREPAEFAALPGSPFAYWVSDSVRQLFVRALPLASDGRLAVAGLQTSDDFRFARAWWEVSPARIRSFWWPFAKGGTFSPFRSSMNLVVNWHQDGKETKAFAETTPGSHHWSRNLRNAEHYFRPALTWLRRSHRVCASVLPTGALFSDGAQAILADPTQLESIGAAVNSAAFDALVKLAVGRTGAGVQFMPGMLAKAPMFAEIVTDDRLAKAFHRGFSLQNTLASTIETSHAFLMPLDLSKTVSCVNREAIQQELAATLRDIDERTFELYGIGPEDRAAIETSLKGVSTAALVEESEDVNGTDEDADDDSTVAAADTLISWLVGVAFGRFDLRIATGKRAIPSEPEPFDPLPSHSPGMWPQDEIRHVIPPHILVDDPGHNDDIREHVANTAANAGWPDLHDLRHWLASEFFPLHIKMYSKSRRKAPIYWQLAPPSASYSVWLYIHAFSNDTLFRVQNDYVAPKLAHEERQLEAMVREHQGKTTAAERKVVAVQEAFVEELRAFLEEVKRVAPLWKPNLDDGVIINFAPLWRLVPQHKAWQKELKATWDALCDEKYDWAHLAMHLWPERIVPKCAIDRSVAIAHGLEDVFWIEDSNGKWTARKVPTRPIDELVRERTSPAVQAALQGLLDAPVTGHGARAGRRRAAGN